jgi:hypothetical protein
MAVEQADLMLSSGALGSPPIVNLSSCELGPTPESFVALTRKKYSPGVNLGSL